MNGRIDKRKFPREKVHFPVRYHMLKDDGTVNKATISSNISSGGIRLRTAEFISKASRMIMEIEIPGLVRPLRAISRVAWIRQMMGSDEYELGGQFLEMNKDDKELIKQYLADISSDDSYYMAHI